MARRRKQKIDACSVLNQIGAGRNTDFHELSSSKVDLLLSWAKTAGYYKPKNANGSRGRYFFARLQRQCR